MKSTDLSKLSIYLQNSKKTSVTLSFEQIENIIGAKLPDTARKQQWWRNAKDRSQAKCWLSVGFKTIDQKYIEARGNVSFVKAEDGKNTVCAEKFLG